MQQTKTETAFRRIYTFDFLRLWFVIPIVMLHVWEYFVGEDIPSYDASFSIYETYRQTVGVVLNYAALFVLSLSFFLWGLKNFRMHWSKYLVFALGVIGLQLRNPQDPWSLSSWFWEVYGYLFIAVTFCRFWPRKWWAALALFVFSIVMLSVPQIHWQPMAHQTAEPWQSILFAQFEGNIGGWFLIPWLFVATLAFSVGQLLSLKKSLFDAVIRNGFWLSLIFWVGAAVCFALKAPPMEPQLGAHFYQFLFMQSPLHFWNHYLVFSGIVTLCLMIDYKWDLSQSPLRYLSYLQWNRNFFLCYFFHFAAISFALGWKETILATPHAIDWLWIAVMIQTELMMQVFVFSLKLYKKLGVWYLNRRIKT